MGGNRVVQPEPPLLHQRHHRGGRGDDLRKRRQVEDRIHRQELAGGLRGTDAVGLQVQDPVAATDQDHGSRGLAGGDGGLHNTVDAGEPGLAGRLGLGSQR